MPTLKPKHLRPEYGAQFGDASIVAAYRYRPPYPAEVFEILDGLMVDGPRLVLDAGCGSGDLAIPLARIVERVDAIDLSAAMVKVAQDRAQAADLPIHFIHAAMEDATLSPPYALVTAAESLHWMEWDKVLPRFRQLLAQGGVLAIVGRVEQANPWWPDLLKVIQTHSSNRDFQPYDLVAELEARNLFRLLGRRRTEPVPLTQTVDDYVESIHSRNGFSRDRMTSEGAEAFDSEARDLLERFALNGRLRFEVAGSVVWGEPAP
ncbi:MAG: class I SAM-dependent methyltransferase [Nitrolancea sp.]